MRLAAALRSISSWPSVALLVALPGRAFALKPIVIEPDQDRIEMTTLGEFYDGAATACRSRRRRPPTA